MDLGAGVLQQERLGPLDDDEGQGERVLFELGGG